MGLQLKTGSKIDVNLFLDSHYKAIKNICQGFCLIFYFDFLYLFSVFLFPKGDIYFSPGLPKATLGYWNNIHLSPEGIYKISKCIIYQQFSVKKWDCHGAERRASQWHHENHFCHCERSEAISSPCQFTENCWLFMYPLRGKIFRGFPIPRVGWRQPWAQICYPSGVELKKISSANIDLYKIFLNNRGNIMK